jgi:hypothetical protein
LVTFRFFLLQFCNKNGTVTKPIKTTKNLKNLYFKNIFFIKEQFLE